MHVVGNLTSGTDNYGKIDGVKCAVLICLLLAGCSTSAEIKRTLRALDKTALAATKAEDRLGEKGEIVLAGVAGVVTNITASTASISSILAGFERTTPVAQASILASLAGVASLTATTAAISADMKTRVEDKKTLWLLYAIGVGLLLVLLHNVFASRSTNKRVRAVHTDVAHVKSRLPPA